MKATLSTGVFCALAALFVPQTVLAQGELSSFISADVGGPEAQEFLHLCSGVLSNTKTGVKAAKKAGWRGSGKLKQDTDKEHQQILELTKGDKILTLRVSALRLVLVQHCSIKNTEVWNIDVDFSKLEALRNTEEAVLMSSSREAYTLGDWQTTLSNGSRLVMSGWIDEELGYYLAMENMERVQAAIQETGKN